MNFSKFFCLVVFALTFSFAAAQDDEVRRGSRVIDDTDSTKSPYGPTTARYYFEEDVFFNDVRLYPVDTAIRDFHRFEEVRRRDNLYQDLGVAGTEIRPIYYQAPETIGVTPGFAGYDAYWEREDVQYWDTRSPYSNMNVIIGGRGRSITRATYSRNIKPHWNFGITYRGMFIDKQISRQSKGDRNVIGNYYHFYTSYQTPDSSYRVMWNFRRFRHGVAQLGGVRTDLFDSFPFEEFFPVDAQPLLTEANSDELRMNMHLFHQFRVGGALQVYHRLDRYRQGNRFTDIPAREPDNAFDWVEVDSASTYDRTTFRSFRNEVGIKGSLLKLFYNGYYAIRNYSMSYNYDTLLGGVSQRLRQGVEHYIGGRVALNLDSLFQLRGAAELLENGNYRIEGSLRSRWLEASLRQLQYEPTLVQQYYRGAHDFWANDFSAVNSTQLAGRVHYISSWLRLSPGLTFTRIGNYVYFRSTPVQERATTENPTPVDVLPFQSSGEQVIASPEVRLGITLWRHLHLRGYGVYSRVLEESDDAIELPDLLINGQLSYENIFFNGNLDMHAGVDLHWKSAYFAQAYDAPTRQFYLQGIDAASGSLADYLRGNPDPRIGRGNRFLVPDFPVVDVFFNAKIKRGRVFFRYNNVLQALLGEGYFATPLYPGLRNTFDFGFDWSFYD